MIREIGIKEKYYPKGYILPSGKFRKIFGLEKREIPKWIYFELCLSIVYITNFLVFVLLYAMSYSEYVLIGIFMLSYAILSVGNLIYILISSWRYC